jgi:hypothetical protein
MRVGRDVRALGSSCVLMCVRALRVYVCVCGGGARAVVQSRIEAETLQALQLGKELERFKAVTAQHAAALQGSLGMSLGADGMAQGVPVQLPFSDLHVQVCVRGRGGWGVVVCVCLCMLLCVRVRVCVRRHVHARWCTSACAVAAVRVAVRVAIFIAPRVAVLVRVHLSCVCLALCFFVCYVCSWRGLGGQEALRREEQTKASLFRAAARVSITSVLLRRRRDFAAALFDEVRMLMCACLCLRLCVS